MAQEQNHRPASAQLLVHRFEIFRLDIARHFFQRHRDHFEAAKQIRAEPLKIPASDPAQFPQLFFIREGNLKIPPRQLAILGKQ